MPYSPEKNFAEVSVQFVKGVGERRARILARFGIHTVEDLLEHQPRRYLDRSQDTPITQLKLNEDATVMGEVVSKQLVQFGKRRLIVRIYDGTGILEGVWFHQTDLFARIFRERQIVAFSGKVSKYKFFQMIHPDFDIISEDREPFHTGQIIPLYPSTEELKRVGLSSYGFRKIIKLALQRYQKDIPETLPENVIKQYKLLSRPQAYHQLHFPESMEKLEAALLRFKFEELFFMELLMALRRHFYQSPVQGIELNIDNHILKKVVASLPFQLTEAQRRVLREIYFDLKKGRPMSRLLQGDVGSGKTVVALLTALMAISGGYQAALMAPTEILAQQHYFNISDILQRHKIRIALLIGSLSTTEKQDIHKKLKAGKIDFVIGTHAIIQEQVQFHKLGLVIIDEQHRFGVLQRAELIGKGMYPHMLVMTATPIPRTLALTLYGDLDVSIIDEMPPGRQEIKTFWRTQEKLPLIYQFIREHLHKGEQTYIVYPIIEESEKLDVKAATRAYEHLKQEVFPDFEVALIHGRLSMEEKERIMKNFKAGKIQVLISTTVIEVGVDVPNATIMLIEHAERFGLSQLHQLRGRIGRGNKKSYCILVTPTDITETAQERMAVLEKTNDGFIIAEEDLRLRGSGEFFGTRQHGLPDLRYSDLVRDQKIIKIARDTAFAIVEKDPHLRLPEHQRVRQHFKRKFAEKFEMLHIS